MKIPHILCVAYYKLNGVHHYFIMRVKEVLNRFFHVYAINVTVTTCVTTFLAYFTMLSPQEENKYVQKGLLCLRSQ
jgi:heme/copper-type cytochrome/quinol oxidase subunit 1